MRFTKLLGLLATAIPRVAAVDLTGYEFIVVGSGAGGGVLAARLALAGRKTLLVEAGDDQGANENYTVPAYQAKSTEDDSMAWDFFVRHYVDDARQARDFKTSYETPGGGEYTGLNPPPGSTMKGTLYPRTGTLGGCTAHNALIAVYPHRSDFDYIASLTGDQSWSANNMRNYFIRMENNRYLLPLATGHGYSGWLSTETAPLNLALLDPQLLSLVTGGAFALGNQTNLVFNLATLLAGDGNSAASDRDTRPGYYQIPISTNDAHRVGSREFIVAVRDAKNPNGSKRYPLDVRMNCHVTKVLFNNSSPPKATGVEFVDGKYLYRASPRSRNAGSGVRGTATASREVVIAGGAYNSPQLLKLSGIGPAAELSRFGIPVIKDLPGVGTNLQDHYEITVQGRTPASFSALNGCTFGFYGQSDPCLTRWKTPILGDRGIYESSGFAATMFYKSTVAERNEWDVFAFGGPVNFRGYFPNYSVNATVEHDWFSWAILKSHPRNTAGSVTLRSSDPLDVPNIVYNYFDTGSGDFNADLQAMTETVKLTRDAFSRQLIPIREELPGAGVRADDDIKQYIKDTAWGHHASSTCPIGADNDPMAVLDSSFRVRGVAGLRVVDASVYPRIPGTFTAVSTYMVGEKAADVILSQNS
ncbi:oxygen-dependent choline dehydrogenase [Colletotrichum spaethianum]|uniref:Oxygen-dependent choline dehydrogenase n=1 Tax=Colletotrichum spaethianum TaxID=700344 RepID=A0AA37P8V8_9PEZI|nr:oxygen-dependent choline dehydrogenase [Colletotrichum spaethianum]GKT47786.1 oxygen-dependent choline dehydrogenase [Colletotrichum spaethianum]